MSISSVPQVSRWRRLRHWWDYHGRPALTEMPSATWTFPLGMAFGYIVAHIAYSKGYDQGWRDRAC
jgi:hypothetical protein